MKVTLGEWSLGLLIIGLVLALCLGVELGALALKTWVVGKVWGL